MSILSIPSIASFVNQKGIPCIRVIDMRKTEKKTEYITFRTDSATKAVLENLSEEKKWSISQLVEEIVKDWLQQKQVK